jgi:type I restriction enzyme M protein
MATTTTDIVQKLWSLCHVLRDDGITYHQYVTELTYLLFLKMAQETEREDQIPEGYRWRDLEKKTGISLLNFYRALLLHLGTEAKGRVQEIYANASTSLREPRNLKKLVDAIDDLDWYDAREEGLGNLYEGLLEKNASEKKSGAGQYFTPRALIDSIVRLIQPQPGELIQDPAAGTGGFLIAADRYIKEHTDNLYALSRRDQNFQIKKAFYGVELVPETHRLALMNLMLHGIEGDLWLGDSLSPLGERLPKANAILTNPPFGTKKGGGLPTRGDFTYTTSNKQLAFLQHVYRGLVPGGRAAIVVPDNVLFEENTGTQIRTDLMNKVDLHTILRLPTGIFYAQGVQTNVLFFTRGYKDNGNTREVWVYDLRTNMPSFGKRTILSQEHFSAFEMCFGNDPCGKGKRKDQGPNERFRKFSYKQIQERRTNLDILWLRKEGSGPVDHSPDPGHVIDSILTKLRLAIGEIENIKRITGKNGNFYESS